MTTTSDLKQAASDHANDLGHKVKTEVQNEASVKATQAKNAAANKVQGVANAANAAADQLDASTTQAQAIQQVADRIEDVAAKLRVTDVTTLSRQATDIARANPFLFIGGAAVAGFAAARFLKARDPQRSASQADVDPWGGPYAGSRGGVDRADDHKTVLAQINGGRDHA